MRIEKAIAKILYGQAMLYNSILVLEQEITMIGNKLGIGDDEFPEQNAKIMELTKEVNRIADEIDKLNKQEDDEVKELAERFEQAVAKMQKSPIQAFSDLAPKAQEGGPQI